MSTDEIEWEYSIAYPEGDGWNTDGAESFDTLDEAVDELNVFGDGFLDSDRIVRRRKAGPWEPVPEPDGNEASRG